MAIHSAFVLPLPGPSDEESDPPQLGGTKKACAILTPKKTKSVPSITLRVTIPALIGAAESVTRFPINRYASCYTIVKHPGKSQCQTRIVITHEPALLSVKQGLLITNRDWPVELVTRLQLSSGYYPIAHISLHSRSRVGHSSSAYDPNLTARITQSRGQ